MTWSFDADAAHVNQFQEGKIIFATGRAVGRIAHMETSCEYPLILSTYPFKGVTCTFKVSASSTKPCQ
jgi:hypothetical protein